MVEDSSGSRPYSASRRPTIQAETRKPTAIITPKVLIGKPKNSKRVGYMAARVAAAYGKGAGDATRSGVREGDVERGAFADAALDPRLTAVRLRDLANDREADARAALSVPAHA